jgi:hypothetical protein
MSWDRTQRLMEALAPGKRERRVSCLSNREIRPADPGIATDACHFPAMEDLISCNLASYKLMVSLEARCLMG